MRPYAPKLAILTIVVALVALVVITNSATTGSEAASQSLPDEVDRLIPVSGGTILRQETIGIDVADGYAACVALGEGDTPTEAARELDWSRLSDGRAILEAATGTLCDPFGQLLADAGA